MKAIRLHQYGTPDTLSLEEAPVPGIADHQVLVKIHATSVNHIDYLKASGALKQFHPLSFPWIPGRDFAGTVQAVGKGVTAICTGRRRVRGQ
jgi:NADPH:quinone reductase-like Zn-dependent oxidoreductase